MQCGYWISFLVFLLTLTSKGVAQESKGQYVYPKSKLIQAYKDGKTTQAEITGIEWVIKEENDRVLIDEGWVQKDSVLLVKNDSEEAANKVAVNFYTNFIRNNPSNGWGYTQRAFAYYFSNFPHPPYASEHGEDLAIKDCNEAIRIDPNNAQAFYFRGKMWAHKTGERDRAISDFAMATRLNPDFAEAFRYKAAILVSKGELDRAIDVYTQAINIEPSASYFLNRASLWRRKGEYGRAIHDYEHAVKIGTKKMLATACKDLAWLLATCPDDDQVDGEKAIEMARKAIETDGKTNRELFQVLAAAYAASGDFDAANEHLDRAERMTNARFWDGELRAKMREAFGDARRYVQRQYQ